MAEHLWTQTIVGQGDLQVTDHICDLSYGVKHACAALRTAGVRAIFIATPRPGWKLASIGTNPETIIVRIIDLAAPGTTKWDLHYPSKQGSITVNFVPETIILPRESHLLQYTIWDKDTNRQIDDGGYFTGGSCSDRPEDGFRSCFVDAGELVSIEIVPKSGWAFDSWDVRIDDDTTAPGVPFNPYEPVNINGTSVSFNMPDGPIILTSIHAKAFVTSVSGPNLAYCLTTSVHSGQGSITQPGCNAEPKGPNEDAPSCASDFEEGSTVQLTSDPLVADGWEVFDWVMTRSDDDSPVAGYFDTATVGATAVSITMPPFDIDVQVIFTHGEVNLILKVKDGIAGNGKIRLVSPTGPSYDNNWYETQVNMSLFSSTVRIGAEPKNSFAHEIESWSIDGVIQAGVTTSEITVPLTVVGNTVTVEVAFVALPACDTNNLDITIIGNGSVSPPEGDYCDYSTLSLNPIPAFGYFFKRWEYDVLSGITLNGIVLNVPMSSPHEVTAIFEQLPDFEVFDAQLFYCPSTTYKNNVISFDFTNNNLSYDRFHFRINFYTDSTMKKLLYSASSLADNKRWFYNDTAYEQFPEEGAGIDSLDTVNIVYDPEILPQQITETQAEKSVNSITYEYPLVCGIKYYVEVQSYDLATGLFSFQETMSIILDCDSVDSHYWSYNKDDNNWLCSAQGKVDLQVSSSSESQSICSAVSSNMNNLFQIVWQTRRDGVYQVYGAIWDSELDYLYSSAQGRYDELKLPAGYSPIILTDQANNFYIAGHTTEGTIPGSITNDIYINACPLPSNLEGDPGTTSSSSFARLCAPGMNVYLDSSYDQIKFRVYDEDIDGSLVINKDKVVPIINKKSVRLDIDGISGAYAVRLRNTNDPDWSGWINIDNNLYYSEGQSGTEDDNLITMEDISYDAFRIDNSRFIVPWDVDRQNSLKRICCQVLTLYGITNTFCLDLFFNFDIPRHAFEFYVDSDFSISFPTYNGQYVLSIKNADGTIQTNGTQSTVYFKVIFSEPIYANEGTSPPTSYINDQLRFNVIQQGINDGFDQGSNGLLVIDDKTFSGSFIIFKEDGIFNKDGNSFIEVVFPEVTTLSTCLSDSSDMYNMMITDTQAAEYKDLTPEEVYDKIETNKAGKVFMTNQFKQYYDQDDSNFKFGNPGYFRG